MDKWNYKTVVITGANSGIGYAILRKLAQAGMKAVGFDIRTDNLEVKMSRFSNLFLSTFDHFRDLPVTLAGKSTSNKSMSATMSP